MHPTLEEINKLMIQAKKYEDEDSSVMAISLYQQAAEKFLEINDMNGTAMAYIKAIQILKAESEFFKAAMILRRLGNIFEDKGNLLEAARQFSRSGTLFKDVKEFQESANSYSLAADMFYQLKDKFYVEAGKHYKMATLSLINSYQHELAEYQKYFDNAMEAFKIARDINSISQKDYLLYIINFYTDAQDALQRNGIYREESVMYIKKMDAIREVARLNKNFSRFTTMSLWKWTCDYGESIGKWFWWVIADVLFFAIVHYYAKVVTNPQGNFMDPWESLYFSVNFFTTNGFGGYTLVNHFARLIAGLNITTGVAMTAVFITIIARKITR